VFFLCFFSFLSIRLPEILFVGSVYTVTDSSLFIGTGVTRQQLSQNVVKNVMIYYYIFLFNRYIAQVCIFDACVAHP
jgi:hypothetical protein